MSKSYQMANGTQENPEATEHSATVSPSSFHSSYLRWTQILETDFWVLFFRKLCLASTGVKKDIKTFVKEHFASSFLKKMRFLHPCFCILLKTKVKIEPVKFFPQRCPLLPISTDFYQ